MRRDHPRSRGVYARADNDYANVAGSSPLARGLPCHYAMLLGVAGIIPARAGFTRVHVEGHSRNRDHPRSRGVYNLYGWITDRREGSSPLARGLRARVARGLPQQRIIPARAGFTLPAAAPSPRRRDHPRSRGVYRCTGRCGSPGRGSSPLARGLQRSTG